MWDFKPKNLERSNFILKYSYIWSSVKKKAARAADLTIKFKLGK